MSHAQPHTPVSADRNLLFGILALQMDFITRDAFIQAMHAWVLEKPKPLGQILGEQGELQPEQRNALDAMIAVHLKAHGNDPQKSLAALSSVSAVRNDLRQVADADVQASIHYLGTGRKDGDDPPDTRPQATPPPPLSRFRILRAHAKGGLGEVFVAHDEEVHRQVALKEIQFHHADNPDSRARFVLEAEITGGLEHPGIVPVYGLGHYPDGRPFYAMRFIKGDSLQEAIDRSHQADVPGRDDRERNLALRDLLGRFIDVCNAVGYAHSRGVLHRDLKPQNIMLGKYGETLVVDWGLAKALGQAEANSEEEPLMPTMAGEVTPTVQAGGTPQYMSPEQAANQLRLLGPATDVYSLGATLYCLLTAKPPFTDREAGVLYAKIGKGDFPRPRHVKAGVPAPLEAVCLKAMALRQMDRYPSPASLASDVERWLADEPVSAYAEPWPVRAGRWMRKHRTLVGSSVVGLVLALAYLGTLAVLIQSQKRELAGQNVLLAEANTRERASAERAQQAIEDMTSKDALKFLETQKELRPEQRRFLERAVEYYREYTSTEGVEQEQRARHAAAYHTMGDLQARLGLPEVAQESYAASIAERERLVAEQPQVPDFQNELALTLVNLAQLCNASKDWGEAKKLLDSARPHHEAALKADSRNMKYKGHYRNYLLVLSDSRLGLGDHAVAAITAGKLAQLALDPKEDCYASASVFSRCAPLGEKDTKLSESKRKELVKAYADQAMGMLRQAVKAGFKDAAQIKKDTGLDPLRGREDFKKLIAELERKTIEQSKKATRAGGSR
jgi:serine/threonine-protein kinase